MKTFKKILNILFIISMILIIFINLYVLYIRIIKKENMIKFFGHSALLIISGSMEPTININDLIIIKEEDSYKLQDIITYKEDDTLITHRVVEISENAIITKGDNNNTEDKPIQNYQIEGKVIYKIDNFGQIIGIINSPIGITVLLTILFFSIRGIWNTKERR